MSSRQSRAVKMAQEDMAKVLESFAQEEPFMQEKVDPRTAKRRELLVTAAPDIQQMIEQGMPQQMAERLARMDIE